jgi:Phage head-tail joining protein
MASLVKIVGGRPTLEIGALRHSVTIQQSGPSSPPAYDAAGVVANAWYPFATAMAAMDAVRGTDVIKGGQTGTQLFMTVAMWWQNGILPNMRVVTEYGSVFVIQSVENVLEMNVALILNCLGLGANE